MLMLDSPGQSRQSSGVISSSPVLLVAAGLLLLSAPSAVTANGGSLLLIALPLILAVMAIRRRGSRDMGIGRVESNLGPASLFPFAAFALLSSLWAERPGAVILASSITLLALVFGLSSGRRLDAHSAVLAVMLFAFVATVSSVVLAIAAPHIAIVQEGYQSGSLKGIYTHRNHLAYVAFLGVTSALVGASLLRLRWVPHLVLVVCSFGLWQTRSASAIFLLLVSAALLLIVRTLSMAGLKYRALVLFVCSFGVVVSVWVLSTGAGRVLSLLDRDPTLTGRTDIWRLVLAAWAERPLLGYGWGVPWLAESTVQNWVSFQAGFRVFHAHNSYLDVLLQVGVVGLVLFVVPVVTILVRAARGIIANAEVVPVAHCVFVVVSAIVAYSMVEVRISQALGMALLALFGGLLNSAIVANGRRAAQRAAQRAGGPLRERARRSAWAPRVQRRTVPKGRLAVS